MCRSTNNPSTLNRWRETTYNCTGNSAHLYSLPFKWTFQKVSWNSGRGFPNLQMETLSQQEMKRLLALWRPSGTMLEIPALAFLLHPSLLRTIYFPMSSPTRTTFQLSCLLSGSPLPHGTVPTWHSRHGLPPACLVPWCRDHTPHIRSHWFSDISGTFIPSWVHLCPSLPWAFDLLVSHIGIRLISPNDTSSGKLFLITLVIIRGFPCPPGTCSLCLCCSFSYELTPVGVGLWAPWGQGPRLCCAVRSCILRASRRAQHMRGPRSISAEWMNEGRYKLGLYWVCIPANLQRLYIPVHTIKVLPSLQGLTQAQYAVRCLLQFSVQGNLSPQTLT